MLLRITREAHDMVEHATSMSPDCFTAIDRDAVIAMAIMLEVVKEAAITSTKNISGQLASAETSQAANSLYERVRFLGGVIKTSTLSHHVVNPKTTDVVVDLVLMDLLDIMIKPVSPKAPVAPTVPVVPTVPVAPTQGSCRNHGVSCRTQGSCRAQG